jgi:hypothetical protein
MMTATVTTKSGRGRGSGVVSELTTYWDVLPGHEEELRAAIQRFADALHDTPAEMHMRTGLRDSRQVIFDDGRRLMWATTFETPWDPYVDDFILIGIEAFTDWMQHTAQGAEVFSWVEQSGGIEKLGQRAGREIAEGKSPELETHLKRSTPGLKAIIQSVQTPATGYFNLLSGWTTPQIFKAKRVEEAFQQVLDDPAAEEALKHPALKPLLEQAAD